MDLPNYANAEAAAAVLRAGHDQQHRCTDSRYYSPADVLTCPVNTAVRTLADTIAATRALPHQACHDPAHVIAVADAMCTHPLGHHVDLRSLGAVQGTWWIDTARLAMEAHAALLDPTVATP